MIRSDTLARVKSASYVTNWVAAWCDSHVSSGVLDTRRDVDVERNGRNIVLIEKKFFDHSAWYFVSNARENYVMATMVKASPKLASVFFLTRDGLDLETFGKYATSVLQGVRVEP